MADGFKHSRRGSFADAKNETLVLAAGELPLGPKQPIPYGEGGTVIRIGVLENNGMVDTVHIGRNQHTTHPRLEPCGQRHVGVVEHRGCVEQQLEGEYCDNGGTECRD